MENSRQFVRSESTRSEIEVSCCWALRKAPSPPPPPPPPVPLPTTESNMMNAASKVVPAPSRNNNASIAASSPPHTPRLLRCHAIRRDLFNNWTFEDFTAGCA